MATIDLGKIKLVWRGTYNNGTAYTVDDVVEYTDTGITSAYICVANSTGNAPSSSGTAHASWNYMTKGVADPVPSQSGNADKYLTTNGSAASWAAVPSSAVNKVINGGMAVQQRGGYTGNTSGYYCADRFYTNMSTDGQLSIAGSTNKPDGFGYSTKWGVGTADSSVAAAHYSIIQYKFEGQDVQDFAKGTSSAKQFALSFYVKSLKTGVYTVELEDNDNSRSCSKTFTVSDTNWNRYTLVYPADTTGAFDFDNAKSMTINFWLQAGTDYTSGTLATTWGSITSANRAVGQVNFLDSTSNEFYMTGVQLEVGGTCNDFVHESYNETLNKCLRYYQNRPHNLYGSAWNPGHSTEYGALSFDLFVPMRTTPTFTYNGLRTTSGVSTNVYSTRVHVFMNSDSPYGNNFRVDAEL